MSKKCIMDDSGNRVGNNIGSDFCAATSAHGFSHLSSSKSVVTKSVWIFVLMIATAGLSFHLYGLVSSYLEYNYFTSVTHQASEPLQVLCLPLP